MASFPTCPSSRRGRPFPPPGRLLALALAALLVPGWGILHSQERAPGSDFILVTEEPWKRGEVRSYSILFDGVPFGREAIRMTELRGEGPNRSLKFSQALTLDLRALGQKGFLTLHSLIQYERVNVARSYRVEGVLRESPEYFTYPRPVPRAARTVLSLELPASCPRMTWETGGTAREIRLPPVAGSALVDPLSMGHWERLFLGDRWRVGQTRTLDLLLPAGPSRFDYHLDSLRTDPPAPERVRVSVTVEAREPVEVFSVPIPAFRCRVPELGLTLWVSGSGGILRYDDGRGLVAHLER